MTETHNTNNNIRLIDTWQRYDSYNNAIIGVRYFYLHSVDYVDFFFDFPRYETDAFTLSETSIDELEYWNYLSYELTHSEVIHIEFSENITLFKETTEQKFEFDFQTTEGKPYNSKFYYTSITIRTSDLGDWGILWNWLRNSIVWLFNTTLLTIQFILYVMVAGINILFGFLFIQLIIPFVWNVLLYWLLYEAISLLFYTYIGFMVIVVIIASALVPVLAWMLTEGLPALIYGIIVSLSWIFALLFFVLTLGQGDVYVLQSIIEAFLTQIALFFMDGIPFIVKYIPELLSYIGIYFLLIGFGYLKLVYIKAKGYVNRMEQLNSSLDAYLMPIDIGYSILSKIKELIIGWI